MALCEILIISLRKKESHTIVVGAAAALPTSCIDFPFLGPEISYVYVYLLSLF